MKLLADDGKLRETDCANTNNRFRIIHSIPSPKAEPFKQWLAQVGYDRVKEIENPELAQKRMKEILEKVVQASSTYGLDKKIVKEASALINLL